MTKKPNYDVMTKAADRLRDEPDEAFSMSGYISPTKHSCGTVACIAGHTLLATGATSPGGDADTKDHKGTAIHDAAADILGLTPAAAGDLFTPVGKTAHVFATKPNDPRHVSKDRAERVLRDMVARKLDAPDWDVVR